MKVTCPKCESEDVQRLAMIYQHGTATSVGTSTTLADVGGDLAVAGTQSAGQSQSLLAQQAAPPQPKPLGSGCTRLLGCLSIGVVGLALIGLAVGLSSLQQPREQQTAIGEAVLWACVAVLFGFLAYAIFGSDNAITREAEEYNRTTYPRLKEQWERTWLCLRCGNRFEASL